MLRQASFYVLKFLAAYCPPPPPPPPLPITRSLKIVLYFIIEHIKILHFIPLAVYSIHLAFVEKMHTFLCLIYTVLIANAQLYPRVPLSVFYLKSMPLSKPSIPCVILKTYIWSPRTRLISKVVLDLHN